MRDNAICGAVAALVAICIAPCAFAAGITIEATPLPGQLDILQGTAIKLGGTPDKGKADPASYSWTIAQGEGGKLYDADKSTAIFQAPAIDKDLELFVIECTAGYAGLAPAKARLHIRVHRAPPSQPEPAQEEGADDTAWLDEIYREKRTRDAQRQSRRTQVIPVPSHHYYPHWGFGWGWGWGWGGFIDYPVYVPIIVPDPGGEIGPGDGNWAEPMPVPYDELVTGFPEEIAGQYMPQDYPFAGMDLPEYDIPVEAFDVPYLPADAFDAPMIDPGFGVDDFGW